MFNKIKLYGEQESNFVWSKNGTMTNDDINTLVAKGIHTPTWDINTLALATFTSDIDASDVSIPNDIVGYRIQRQNIKENILYKIADIDETVTKINDYNIPNLGTYKYYITPIFYNSEDIKTLGNPIETDTVDTNWDCWSIIALDLTNDDNIYTVDTDNIWIFSLNAKSDSINPKFDKTYTEGFGRFAKASNGDRNYIESGLKTLIGKITNNNYYDTEYDTADLEEKWINFCNDGRLKLFKDRKGRVLPIDIKDTSIETMDETIEQALNISFSYIHLADRKEISVYEVV